MTIEEAIRELSIYTDLFEPDKDTRQKEYFRDVIGMYQNIRGIKGQTEKER